MSAGRDPAHPGGALEGKRTMARKQIEGWKDCSITDEEKAALRGIAEAVFKRNGGRGEMTVSWKNWNTKGTIAFDEAGFRAGNAAPQGNDEEVAVAKAWANAVAEKTVTLKEALAALEAHPMVASMVKRLVAPALPMPAGKMTKTMPMPGPAKQTKKTGTNG